MTAKAERRRTAIAGRKARSPEQIDSARAAIAAHLLSYLAEMPQPAGRAVIAGYLPLPTEPLDPGLASRLTAAGYRVLLPVATAGAALNWAEFSGESRSGAFGIQEPVGELLGVDAVATADAVLVPALLVDANGVRLGRGGGHYDRTLARARGELIAVVFDDELVEELPAEAFDLPVTAVLTPGGGVRRVPATSRPAG